jgi:hypothetical protein
LLLQVAQAADVKKQAVAVLVDLEQLQVSQ